MCISCVFRAEGFSFDSCFTIIHHLALPFMIPTSDGPLAARTLTSEISEKQKRTGDETDFGKSTHLVIHHQDPKIKITRFLLGVNGDLSFQRENLGGVPQDQRDKLKRGKLLCNSPVAKHVDNGFAILKERVYLTAL